MVFHSLPFPPLYLPHYLVPPSPFRRRTSSTDTTTTTSSTLSSISSTTSTATQSYLTGHTSLIRCSRCHADLAFTSQIISKGFTGRHGRAYLVAPPSSGSSSSAETLLPNTFSHKAVPRHLVTGMHTVADISCMLCGAVLGWKYVSAEDEGQRYKVGKFILETKRCGVVSCWEKDGGFYQNGEDAIDESVVRWSMRVGGAGGDHGEVDGRMPAEAGTDLQENDVEFDSQDEDECEDLFAGTWTPQGAMRKRGRKFGLRSGIL